MEFPLVAGRFAPLAGRFALDLATSERVLLVIERAGRDAEHRGWLERCGALTGVWHPSLAELLDFGGLGATHRFAAFAAQRHLPTPAPPASWVVERRSVEAFLTACGIDAPTADAPYAGPEDRPLVLPALTSRGDADAASGGGAPVSQRAWFGVRLVKRAVLDAIVELLTLDAPTGLAVIRIEAAPGSGGRSLLRACAREARRHGYVPVSTAALRWVEAQPRDAAAGWTMTLARQHLVVLHDGRHDPFERLTDLWMPLLRMSGRHARTRIVFELTAGGGARRFRLTPLGEHELMGMVVFGGEASRGQQRLRAAAQRAGGRPGPFIEAVARLYGARPAGATRRYTVHERAAEYGAVQRFNTHPQAAPPTSCPQPTASAPAIDRVVDDTLAAAVRLMGRGRHAAAERASRQAHAMAVRRELWMTAAEAAIRQAHIRRTRGDVVGAERVLLAALEHGGRNGPPQAFVSVLASIGDLQLADGRVEQAESTLRSASALASLAEDGRVREWLRSLVAVCLWWQGRYEEAHAALDACESGGDVRIGHSAADGYGVCPSPGVLKVMTACVAARIAVSLNDHRRAREELTRAAHIARELDPSTRAMVHRAEARWHASVGDAVGLQSATEAAVRLARLARHPLDRLAAMAGYVEGCTRSRGRDACSRTVRSLEAIQRRRLPGLLAFRIRLATGLYRGTLTRDRARAECVARRLEALCPPRPVETARPCSASDTRSPMYEDVIEVLGICQDADAEEALVRVMALLRQRTRAASAELVARGGALLVTQPAGGRPSEAARRVIDSGVAVDAAVTDRGIEAAVPIRFGGQVLGALSCRWLSERPIEPAAVMGLLGALAAATAPALHAVVQQRAGHDVTLPPDVELVGESGAMQEIRRAVARAADAPFPVLIQGESGSGKELVARAIHRAGARRGRVFSALNCAALPDDLLEAELFGHARGAFTGAVNERRGLFEEADGGVLFLDEVGELTPRGQAKLLRAIQEGEIKRLGETFARRVDVRIVAATNRPLEQEVAAGRFRRDLRYRLDVIRITIPPLRDRIDDIPVLAQRLWQSAAARIGSRAVLSAATLAALTRYDWPGNVRELQNVLAALAVAAPRRGAIGPSALPVTIAAAAVRGSATLEEARRVFEARYVRAALARSGGHRGRAAAELGVTRQGLAKLIGRLGLSVPETAAEAQSRTA